MVEYGQISELTIVVHVKHFIIDVISSEIWSKHVTCRMRGERRRERERKERER